MLRLLVVGDLLVVVYRVRVEDCDGVCDVSGVGGGDVPLMSLLSSSLRSSHTLTFRGLVYNFVLAVLALCNHLLDLWKPYGQLGITILILEELLDERLARLRRRSL